MKKITYFVIILALALPLFIVSPVSAQGPTGSWATGISCQNQDPNNDASISLVFYSEGSGTEVLTYSDTINAGMSKNYFTSTSFTGLPSNFFGSLVVNSDLPLTCAAEHGKTSTGTMSDPYRFAASKGFNSGEAAPEIFVSQIEKDFYGWNSYMSIQNTTETAVDVTVDFVDRRGNSLAAATENFSIPGYSNQVVYLEDNADIPSNFLGGATIMADDGTTPLVVTATFYNTGADYQSSQIHAYNGATAGSDVLYAPYVLRNYYGYQTGMMIQNVGTTSTSFKITFTFNGVDYVYQHPRTLAPGAVTDLYLPNVAELDAVDALAVQRRFGKAVIEASDTAGTLNPSGELAGNINQDNRGGAGIPEERAGQGATYGAFLSSGGSSTVYIAKWMRNAGLFSSGFNISNFSGTNGTCDISFVADPDANMTNVSIAANSFKSFYGPDVSNLDDGYDSGVIIECSVDVFVITNASANPGSGKYGDSFYQMNADNVAVD